MRGLVLRDISEVSEGDPDKLIDVILACLEGLSMKMAYSYPAKVQLPDAEVILRPFGPNPNDKKRSQA